MYKEKFASKIEIGGNVINIHTATGVYKVHPNQIFQVLIY